MRLGKRVVSGFATFSGVVLLLTACADDGRDLPRPSPELTSGATVTTSPTSTEVAGGSTASLRLTSPGFEESQPIPARFTCDGDNARPPLAWTGVPPGTVELAVTVTDPDANGFVHWVVAGLNPATTDLGSGALPAGAVETSNDAGESGWLGPCPPEGDSAHQYVFTLYALSERSGLTANTSGRDAIQRIAARPGAATRLTATFQR